MNLETILVYEFMMNSCWLISVERVVSINIFRNFTLFSRSFLHEIRTYNVTVEEILNCIFEIDLNDSLVKEVIKR